MCSQLAKRAAVTAYCPVPSATEAKNLSTETTSLQNSSPWNAWTVTKLVSWSAHRVDDRTMFLVLVTDMLILWFIVQFYLYLKGRPRSEILCKVICTLRSAMNNFCCARMCRTSLPNTPQSYPRLNWTKIVIDTTFAAINALFNIY